MIQQCTVVQHGLVSQWFSSSPEKPGEPHACANSEYQALLSDFSSSWGQGYYVSVTTLDINIVHYASPIRCELYGHEYIHMAGQYSVNLGLQEVTTSQLHCSKKFCSRTSAVYSAPQTRSCSRGWAWPDYSRNPNSICDKKLGRYLPGGQ